MIPLSYMEELQKELQELIDRMVTRFDNIGHWCVPRIQRIQQHEIFQRQTSIQIGDCNTMEINLGTQTESLVFMEQVGDKNKMIIELEDRRQTEYIELESSGEVKLRMVLRSNQTEAWTKITDNIMKLDLEELNSNPVLRENDVVVDSIEKGSVVVSLNTSNGIRIKDCLRNLFNALYDVLDIESILQKCKVSEMIVHGYIYCPEEFKEGPNTETCQELVIIRHYSWTTTTTKCDIDVYVSKLMRSLILAEFSTDVDERIEVEIKCGFSSNRALHQITPNEDKLFSDELKTASLELEKMRQTGNSVHLSLKCIGKIRYPHLFDISGPIEKITKTLFGSVSDTALRLSVFTDTHFVNDSVANPGLVFYLKPLSKILDSADEDRLPHIITAMLQGKNTSLLRDIGDIKVKAILEYHEEKGLHIERQKQFGMKYQQMKFQAKCQENDIPEVVNDIFEAYKVKKPYLVIQLLEKGVNPNVRNEKQQTPLHLASENKLERVVEKLISHGAEINVVDEKQETPLFVAARCGNGKIITSLLTHGADPEIRNSKQDTPLYIAAKNGHHHATVVEI